MRIPSFLFGNRSQVKRKTVRHIDQFLNGVSWDEAFGQKLIESKQSPGYFLLDDVSSKHQTRVPNFHPSIFLPTCIDRLERQFPQSHSRTDLSTDEHFQAIVTECLQCHWGTLSLMNPALTHHWIQSPTNQRSFLSACLRYWNDFQTEGRRFMIGLGVRHIWCAAPVLWKAVAKHGVPHPRLQQLVQNCLGEDGIPEPVPYVDLSELLREHKVNIPDFNSGT